MPNTSKGTRLTLEDLLTAMNNDDWLIRFRALDKYSKQKPSIDAIPILRQSLIDPYHGTVKSAAKSLRKLGPKAIDATGELLEAAAKIDVATGAPQSYHECIEAMAIIAPFHPQLIPLIEFHSVRYSNWVPISSSLRALKMIGTKESNILAQQVAEFWMPKLNKMQRRVANKIVDGN